MAHYRVYKLIESTKRATQFYYIPKHNVLIPKCSNSQRVLLTLLTYHKDVHSPVHVSEYPLISSEHSHLFKCSCLSVRVSLKKYVSIDDIKHMEAEKERKLFQQLLKKCDINIEEL